MLSVMDKHQSAAIQGAFEMFCHEKATFVLTPPSIVMGDPAEKRILTEDSFYDL